MVVVEPPSWGDRIFLLRKTYQPQKGGGADKGTVFIRRQANTDRANDAEMDMLQERLLGGQRQPGLELELGWKDGPVGLTPLIAAPEARRTWLDARREVLLRSLREHLERPKPPPARARPTSAGRPLSEAFVAASRMENRTPDQYRREVEEYLQEADEELAGVMADRLARAGANRIRLVARNPSDRNLPGVKLVLHIRGRVWAIDEDDLDDDRTIKELPTRPAATAHHDREVPGPG